ncbi:hypothetical protein SDC9_40968 [bioreactor metagenome]|uniref:Uncharacterized protein n=1 Tax=bioreactor metagenome TaxID=1076179 RepID=A0A644VUC3_9ZZZZ
MAVIVAHRAPDAIGAALGREGLDGRRDPRAKLAQHRLEHMIGADDEPRGLDLARRVAVADVPGEARQIARDAEHRLEPAAHLDEAPVIEAKRLAAGQVHHLGQVDKEGKPSRRDQPLATQETPLVVKCDVIGRALPLALRHHGLRMGKFCHLEPSLLDVS